MRRLLLLFLMVITCVTSSFAQIVETLVPGGAQWRWRKGTNEVSSPTTAWRQPGFNDSAWPTGAMPFYYGLGGISGGTVLSDMRFNYTTVYLRRNFVVADPDVITSLTLRELIDDGFIVWINGQEVQRYNAFAGEQPYNAGTPEFIGSSPVEVSAHLDNPGSVLVAGTNWIAVHLINRNSTSSDLHLDLELTATLLNTNPPAIASVVPAPGSTLGALTEITVFFNMPVTGVDVQDLVVNDVPAMAMTGNPGTNRYTFTVAQPPPGLLDVRWNDAPGITDLGGTPFDSSGAWAYTLVDNLAPELSQHAPVAGATVSQLTQVEVVFNEPVVGVDAADLRVNGQSAGAVSGSETGPYVFTFPSPAAGLVNFSWAGGHGITDLAANPFAGAGWSITLNPNLAFGDVVINEFVAGNTTGLTDEDGERSDWIELYNRGSNAVNLLGWSLTDNRSFPGQWTFPNKILNPGEYLVVFASGKDRRAPAGANKFHTNFKLDLFGEYLALFSPEYPPVAVSEFAPRFPEQRNNYSYGLDNSSQWRYFAAPNPGAPNGSSSILGIAPEPHFSVGRGLFEQPFNLVLTTTLPGATIRYTTDGSEPTAGNGQVYVAPVAVTDTAYVRAAVFAPNYLPSRARTHSYIYLDAILTQPNDPAGFPSTWGNAGNFSSDNVGPEYYAGDNVVPAYYQMDHDPLRVDPVNSGSAIDPAKLQRLKDGLRELPVVSLVLHRDDMFGPDGLYPRSTSGNKSPNEKPCSVEMLMPDGSTLFATTAAIDVRGNASRDPFKTPKHGFKLNFKADYGPTTLEAPGLFPNSPAREFDDLAMRPDFGVSWLHWSDGPNGLGDFQRSRAVRFRDAYVKNTFRDMGHPANHARFFHLMINGLYWGVYDFAEQPFAQFAENYLPASTDGYDVYDQGGLKASGGGTSAAYQTMLGISNLGLNANYELMKQHLDVTMFADYMLLHFFVGAQDWGNNKNWFAVRARVPGPDGRFKYMPWDSENTLLNESINRVPNGGGNNDVPSGLHTKLDDNPQYRLDFADRVHKHMIAPGGALTLVANTARWQFWQDHLDRAIVAESCRWGDYRRDVHQYQSGVFTLYTREHQWLAENSRVLNSYLPNRHDIVLNQLRTAGLYPNIDAPEFRQNTVTGPIIGSGAVGAGHVVAMRNPGAGAIYYTTNGADPRVYYSGEIDAAAQPYAASLTLNGTITIKARVFNGGTWSALNEAVFTMGELGLPLRITEINCNPIGGEAYEFIELQNLGALPLDLSGFSFQGINYVFPIGTVLAPGAVMVLANNANPQLFAARYPSVGVFGYFGGNLSNGGERIAILDGSGNTVVAVHYDDEDGWPTSPDGAGYSLEIIDPHGDPNAPANWRASFAMNGTPGLPPVAPVLSDLVLNEIAADNAGSVTNDGVFPDWIELHNRAAGPVNLANWSLTDDSNARKFVFPGGTSIPAGGFLVVWCDTANSPGLHSGFALSRGGETVSLYDADTNRVDALTFGLQLTDSTVGRVGDEWQLTVPTPGAANSAAALAAATNLAINEWLADSPPGSEDWVELFNRSADAPVALSGLGFEAHGTQFRYHGLSFVAPQGHARLFADERPGADHLEFKLPATAGEIVLYDEAAIEMERVTYGPQIEGVSEGRLPDGTANIVSFPGSVSPGASNYVLVWTGPVLNEVLARNERAALSPWGNYADCVELFNPGPGTFDLGGMAMGRSDDASERWTIPSGVSLAGGEYLVIWCDGSRAASFVAGTELNSGFNLPGESGGVVLFNALSQPVDRVDYGHQINDLPIGRSGSEWRLLASPTPGAANGAAAALGPVSALRINEWMAAPPVGDDWFEFHNTSDLPVAMGGLFVTDDPSVTGVVRSPVAPLSFIAGRDWVILVADGDRSAGRDHANFSLNQLGETLRLYDANTNLIDAVDFGLQADGVSQGRLPDGAENIVEFPATPTPGAANYLPLTSVVINEVLTHTDDPLEDAIELHNPTGSPVNIGGWYLSDSQADLKRYRIPDDTIIPAGGFAVFYQYQFGPAAGDDDAPPFFSFNSARGDSAYLSEADGGGNLTGARVGVSFAAAANGVSFGRYATSIGVDFVAMGERTFGVDNPSTLAQFRTGAGAANAQPLVGPVVISEIMYSPPDWGTNSPDVEEFIELHNWSSSAVDLFDSTHPENRWRLANAVTCEFPADATIPAGGHLLVVPFDPVNDVAALAAFQSRYGSSATLVGPFSGRLDNAGEAIELWRPDNPQSPPHPDAGFVPQILVERVEYGVAAPWPVIAGDDGSSLQRISPEQYGNDPVNWRAGLPTAGLANVPQFGGTAMLLGNGEVRLTFTVQPGFTYQWEYKEDLNDPDWLPLGEPVQASGDTLELDDALAGQPHRFYRLTVLP